MVLVGHDAREKHGFAAGEHVRQRIGKRLGAENYVFWGGREGYENLWVTDMKREQEHMAKFFHMWTIWLRVMVFLAFGRV